MYDKRLGQNHHQSVRWGGISASLSFLQMTHVTFWSTRGMKVARKWRISAWTVFSRVTAVTSRISDGTGLAGRGLAGRLGSCLWDGISGAWVSDVRLDHLFCPLCNPRNDMLLLIWAPTWTLWLLQHGWHLVISNEKSHSAFFLHTMAVFLKDCPSLRQVELNWEHLWNNVDYKKNYIDLILFRF